MEKHTFIVQLTFEVEIAGNTVEEAKRALRKMEWAELVDKSSFIIDSEVQTEEEFEDN